MKKFKGVILNGELLGNNVVINKNFVALCECVPDVMQEFMHFINNIDNLNKQVTIDRFNLYKEHIVDIEFSNNDLCGFTSFLINLSTQEVKLADGYIKLTDFNEKYKDDNSEENEAINNYKSSEINHSKYKESEEKKEKIVIRANNFDDNVSIEPNSSDTIIKLENEFNNWNFELDENIVSVEDIFLEAFSDIVEESNIDLKTDHPLQIEQKDLIEKTKDIPTEKITDVISDEELQDNDTEINTKNAEKVTDDDQEEPESLDEEVKVISENISEEIEVLAESVMEKESTTEDTEIITENINKEPKIPDEKAKVVSENISEKIEKIEAPAERVMEKESITEVPETIIEHIKKEPEISDVQVKVVIENISEKIEKIETPAESVIEVESTTKDTETIVENIDEELTSLDEKEKVIIENEPENVQISLNEQLKILQEQVKTLQEETVKKNVISYDPGDKQTLLEQMEMMQKQIDSLQEERAILEEQLQNSKERTYNMIQELIEVQKQKKEKEVMNRSALKILGSGNTVDADIVDEGMYLSGDMIYKWGDTLYLKK